MNSTFKKWQKWLIAIKIFPIIIFVAVLKFLSHKYGYEVLELNALFTSLVAGTIFLIGFLISGVLSDYKESEKIPSEITSSLKALFDDAFTLYKSKENENSYQFIEYQRVVGVCLLDWLYKKKRTAEMLSLISSMNEYFVEFDKSGTQPNYIIRLKGEQNNLRRLILRVDTIRDTGFVSSAYAVVEIMGMLIATGLIITEIEPFYASLFLTSLVTFLITYMLFLIKDLDNPFDYSINGENGTEVSLKPLHDHILFLNEKKHQIIKLNK